MPRLTNRLPVPLAFLFFVCLVREKRNLVTAVNNIFIPPPLASIYPPCHRNTLIPSPSHDCFITLVQLWPTYSTPFSRRNRNTSPSPLSRRSYISNTNRRFIHDGGKRCIHSRDGLNKIENFSPLPLDETSNPSTDRKWNWVSSLHAFPF